MMHSLIMIKYLLFALIIISDGLADSADKQPEPLFTFDDNTLYRINWIDSQDLQNNNQTIESEELVITNENQHKYRCIIGRVINDEQNNINRSDKNDDLNPYQLLKPLFTKKICSYRPENYWKYEICHGKYIRQYHEDPGLKGSTQEYYLGTFDMENYPKYEKLYEQELSLYKLPTINVDDMQLPYIEINMTDGTLCDLSNKKRFTRVLYVCYENDKHEMYSIKEITTCEYEIIILSSLLCLSPKFKIKKSVENDINCYALDKDVPKIPKGFELNDIETEQKAKMKLRSNFLSEYGIESKTILINTIENGHEVRINFITETDETDNYDGSLLNSHSHIITKFLRGEYCLTGGSGWWKYEFCYGKSVNQFHEENGEKRQIINLGKWNLKNHIEWIEKNSSKKIKPNRTPKQVRHYYSSGDYCEQTKRPRSAEVKLKCRYDPSNPDSMAIYLMEPRTCEYVLGVESTIICDLISNVDQYGIFQFNLND